MKLQDLKSKDTSLLKSNFSVISKVVEQPKVKKFSIFPPNLKFGSALNSFKPATKEFKKIKSLSPVLSENVEAVKENSRLNSTLIKLKLDINNQQDNQNLPLSVQDFVKDIQEKVEKIEKKFGSSSSNLKIREYLNVFDDFSSFFKEFKFFLTRFKRVFEQVYLKSIVLANEVQELREVTRKNLENCKEFKDFNYFSENKLKKVASDEGIVKIPLLKRTSHVSTLKNRLQEEELSLPRQKSSEILEIKQKDMEKTKNFIPKLLLAENVEGVLGFQDEFMRNVDEFSESWRELLEKQKRFE